MNSAKRVAAVLLTTTAFVATSVGGAEAAGTWRQDQAPVAAGNVLAMTQLDKHTTWAAGFAASQVGQGEVLNPMLLARDDRTGTGWKRVATPLDSAYSRINALSASSPRDAWLVGDSVSGDPSRILTEHWDGTAWTVADAPTPAGTVSAGFLGVATVTPRDAWAVGWTQHWRGNDSIDSGLIEHWDGKKWQQTKLPSGVPDAMLFSVTATGPHDVWAGGVLTDGTDQPALLHYDGKTWTSVTVPDTGLNGEFNSVVAKSPNDVWATGRTLISDKDRGHPLVAHYDGHTWKTVPAPGTGVIFAAAPSAGGVTVVGYDKNTEQSYGQQYDGHTWRSLNLPTEGVGSTPYSLAVNGRTITVGGAYNPDETSPFQPLLLTGQS